MNERERFPALDLCRGLAALAVVAGHVRLLSFATYASAGTRPLWSMPLYLLTGLGRQAVVIFFVLSGFLIGRAVLSAVAEARWSWQDYGIRRMARLWTVLIPALVLTAVLDLLRGRPFDGLTFIGNVAFLQTITVPTFGSNDPLWSLAYEFWYYLLFPLLVVAFAKTFQPSARIACAVCALAIGLWLPPIIAAYGVIWLMGAAAWSAYRADVRATPLFIAGGVGFCAVLVISKLITSPSEQTIFVEDLILGASFALMLPRLAARRGPLISSGAAMSYTLYLTHFPILMFLAAALAIKPQPPGANAAAMFAALLFAALACSWLMYLLFERHTSSVRRWLHAKLWSAEAPLPGRSKSVDATVAPQID